LGGWGKRARGTSDKTVIDFTGENKVKKRVYLWGKETGSRGGEPKGPGRGLKATGVVLAQKKSGFLFRITACETKGTRSWCANGG